jgi:isochorismate hydrolase
MGTMSPDYLNEIDQYNVRQARPTPGRCALLVIDMQQYFLSLASPIIGNILSVIEACRYKDVRIIFSQHGHKDVSKDGGMLAEWWGDLIEYGSKEWELINSLKPLDTEGVLDKNRYSVFHSTGLDESLKSRKIDELIITGVMTNCCCETTARDAFVKDYRVFFVSDATATVNDELHIASLKNLAFGFAYIISTEQLCRYLSNKE